MRDFMIEGGVNMWFILALGLAMLIGAGLFAWRPSELRLGPLRALTAATVFSSLAGFTAGVARTFAFIRRLPADEKDHSSIIALTGISESCANLIFGFTFLAVTWLVIAIGLRRLAVKEAAGG